MPTRPRFPSRRTARGRWSARTGPAGGAPAPASVGRTAAGHARRAMRRDDTPRPGEAGDTHEGTRLRRATFLRTAAAAVVAPSVLAERVAAAGRRPGGSPAVRDAWPQAAHDLAATRATPAPPSGLAVRWRRPIAGGMTGPPAIVHGRVVAASLGGEVAAFDLADGRE